MNRTFILLVLLTNGWWWAILQPQALIFQWSTYPGHVVQKVSSLFGPNNVKPMEDMRWISGNRLFFNKLTVIVKEGVEYWQFLAPRFYFLAGDGTNFSSRKVEPIPTILFPFWIMGWFVLVREKKWKPLVWLALAGAVGYLSGQKNMAILLPVLVVYAYISAVGINSVSNIRIRRKLILAIVIYSLYVLARGIWIR